MIIIDRAMAQSFDFKSLLPSFVSQFSPSNQVLFVDISSALIAHACFRRFEPEDVSGGLSRFALFAVAPVVTAALSLPSQPWYSGLIHCGLFACFLFSSILLYRVSPFHPMAKYPGPLVCKISKLWMAWLFRKGKVYVYLKELHTRYGPVVRIGPNEISVVEAELLPQILGNPDMPKGSVWEGRQPAYVKDKRTGSSVVTIRDDRESWVRAFGPEPLQDYEELLIARANELVGHLKDICNDSPNGVGRANMTKWISYLSYDMMGDTAFGEGFQLMREGDKNGHLENMRKANTSKAITTAVPWALGITRLLQSITGRTNSGRDSDFTHQLAQKRIEKTTKKRDLFYNLSRNMNVPDEKLAASNASLAVLAGSDATSAALTGMLYYLLRYPDYFRRLQNEIDKAFPPSECAEIQIDKLANLELLNAIIHETLRLEPAVSSYMQRAPVEGSGGKKIGDMFIPERTAVVVPPYVLHRDPRYFSPYPDEFWPERWLINTNSTANAPITSPKLSLAVIPNELIILTRSAFIPFGIGPTSCPGRPLAMSQLRYVLAVLVYNFDFLFDTVYEPHRWEEDIVDKLVVMKGPLPVQMRVRARSCN